MARSGQRLEAGTRQTHWWLSQLESGVGLEVVNGLIGAITAGGTDTNKRRGIALNSAEDSKLLGSQWYYKNTYSQKKKMLSFDVYIKNQSAYKMLHCPLVDNAEALWNTQVSGQLERSSGALSSCFPLTMHNKAVLERKRSSRGCFPFWVLVLKIVLIWFLSKIKTEMKNVQLPTAPQCDNKPLLSILQKTIANHHYAGFSTQPTSAGTTPRFCMTLWSNVWN